MSPYREVQARTVRVPTFQVLPWTQYALLRTNNRLSQIPELMRTHLQQCSLGENQDLSRKNCTILTQVTPPNTSELE